MKICLVSKEYPPDKLGGIGTQTFLKAHALAARGHVVHVVTRAADGIAESTDLRDGVVVHRITDPSSALPFSEPSVHWVSYSAAVAAKLYELAEELDFDVIEFAEYEAEGFVYTLDTHGWRTVPVVVMLHASLAMFLERTGWPPPGSPLARFGTFMEETVVQGADMLLAASRNIADFWTETKGVAPERISVVHTAVDPTVFTPPELHPDRRPEVLFVGRIDGEKGVFDVVEAVLALSERHPSVLCRIAGAGDADAEQRLHELIGGDVAAQFELAGFVPFDRLPGYYASCDVFAAPAPREHGVASVYLEAMSCARPVVASTTGGAPEAVVDGETGFLVAPGDHAALVDRLDALLSSPELRQRLGQNGRARVLELFTADRVAERTLSVYERVVSERDRQHV